MSATLSNRSSSTVVENPVSCVESAKSRLTLYDVPAPAGDFTRVNGFHKPTKQQPMIFYCRSGVRAQTAVDLAKAAGYKWSVLWRHVFLQPLLEGKCAFLRKAA